MLAVLSEYIGIGDVAILATLIVVGLLTFRSQRPRILKEENAELAEENKRLREEKTQWSEQKAELVAQIRTLENRINILESKDTERLYDLMKSHDERVSATASHMSEVLQALTNEINSHIVQQQEVAGIILPLAREIQQHLGGTPPS